MKRGRRCVPISYQIHHKHPLKLEGDNSHSNFILNFILIQSHPNKPNYYSALTAEQNKLSDGS